MNAHMTHTPACRHWLSVTYAHVKQRHRKRTHVRPGTVNDLRASVWNDDDAPINLSVPYALAEGDANATNSTSASSAADTFDDSQDAPEDDDEQDAAEDALKFMTELLELQHGDLFEVLEPPPAIGIGEAGPGPTTLKNRLSRMAGAKPRYMDPQESTNTEFSTEHPTAGRTVRMTQHVHERWAACFGTSPHTDNIVMDGTGKPDLANVNIYHPFASKLDWDIAKWMVKDGIGHSSFNRLLQIDGVSCSVLLLHILAQ